MSAAESQPSFIDKLWRRVHRHFLAGLLVAYALAATLPGFGMWLRNVELGTIPTTNRSISPILVMLALLLFNAGLGMKKEGLLQLLKRPWVLLAGLALVCVIPYGVVGNLGLIRNILPPDLKLEILLGLAAALTMPAANSSAGWSQNSGGNVTFSVSFIVISTFLSSVSTPLILRSLFWEKMDATHVVLNELAAAYSGTFVLLWVLVPTSAGYLARALAGADRVRSISSAVKLTNCLIILLLNYSNGAVSLPHLFTYFSFLHLMLLCLFVGLLCSLTFLLGWGTARLLGLERDYRSAFGFSLGMKNTGLALVLVTLTFPQYRVAQLTIILYTLLQHIVAASYSHIISRRDPTTVNDQGLMTNDEGMPKPQ